MSNLILWQESGSIIRIYYFLVLLAFLYFLYKYQRNNFLVLIILIFFNGLFGFLGKDVQNGYRIFLLGLTLYYIFKIDPFRKRHTLNLKISFAFFTLTFLITAFVNRDYLLITSSQYSRYFILFSIYFILDRLHNNNLFNLKLESLLSELLLLQIILSIAKLLLIGPAESIVGSVASQGGAVATSLPILGFMVIWLINKGKINRREWLFTVGLVFIAFISLKRAIWFTFPVIFVLMIFFVPKKEISGRVLGFTLFFVPIIFYLGIRLNPSLNKEGKIGGSFDLAFALNFARTYNFGEQEDRSLGSGRGGATLLLFNKLIDGRLSREDWFGYGLRYIYTTDYQEFDELKLGISSKGAATGVFQTFVASGIIGIIATIWFIGSLISKTKNTRLKYVLFGLMIWEYFFYTGIIIRELALSFLLVYIILYSGETRFTFNNQKSNNTYETKFGNS